MTDEIGPDATILRPRGPRAGARLRGLSREVWQGVDPVEYVRQLRSDWDDLPKSGVTMAVGSDIGRLATVITGQAVALGIGDGCGDRALA